MYYRDHKKLGYKKEKPKVSIILKYSLITCPLEIVLNKTKPPFIWSNHAQSKIVTFQNFILKYNMNPQGPRMGQPRLPYLSYYNIS